MGKTIRFGENSLIAIKKRLNEIMVGTDSVSHNDVSDYVKLYHGTDIIALLTILKTKRVCASEGIQHGETHGLNWFSLVNDGSFNRGACFSIEVPANEIGTVFKKMNTIHVITNDSCLNISNYNIQVEYFCGHSREGIINLYNNLVNRGEKYPIEWIRDNLFYEWCKKSGNEDTYMSVSDYDFGFIMTNILGEDKVRKEGFIKEETVNEASPEVDEFTIGGEEKDGDIVAGGNYFHSINESSNYHRFNLDYIDSISYTVETDDDGIEYYDGEVYDTDGHHLDFFYGDKDDIEYFFSDNLNLAEKIINKDAWLRGNYYWIEDIQSQFVNGMNVNPNNVDDVNKAAKRLSRPGGSSMFILTDGETVSFHDHAQVQSICDYMTVSKFIELGNIRCGVGNYNSVHIQLIKQPTFEQQQALKSLLYSPGEVYVDFAEPSNHMYPEVIHSVNYSRPDGRRVVNDIMNYFWEGIKPIGESEEKKGKLINETNIPQEFIDRAIKLRPDKLHNWVVIDLTDVNRAPFYFMKKQAAYEHYKFVKMDRESRPVIINLDNYGGITENIEGEVESSEVDLSSFKKRDTLPPGIWKDGETLDSRVRLKLLDIADDFWEFVNLTWVDTKGIIITGSICNFNWSKFSDIDLHLIVDFSEIDNKTEFVKQYLDSKKNEWNNEHEGLKIMGFPVELYVQDIGENPEAGGIYDLEENKWLRKPNPGDIKSIGLNKFNIKDKAAEIMTIIDDMYHALESTSDGHEVEKIGEDASYLWKKVKDLRKKSLSKNGESGAGNIVYKVLRRTGYLDKLFKLSTKVYDRSNSITESIDIQGLDIFTMAKEHFGITYDIRECGYVLPDGTMLDFSGRHTLDQGTDSSHLRGRRGIDHRDIYEIGWSADGNTKNFDYKMEDFIKLGAIRVHTSSQYGTINLYKKPTPKQISVLTRLIQYAKGNVDVEIGDGDESLSYGSYDSVRPNVIIAQINRYFDEGINLQGNISEEKKVDRELIREYLDSDHNLPLYKYFKWVKTASDADKAEDLMYCCSYGSKKYLGIMAREYPELKEMWIQLKKDESVWEDDEFISRYAEVVGKYNMLQSMIQYLECNEMWEDLPSWLTMDFNRIVKNEWCIHFCYDANSIMREGFKWGTDDINRLALTGAGMKKWGEGYNFAYPIGEARIDTNNYGSFDPENPSQRGNREAVIFQTSGVEVDHYGDNERQVVFWGPSAKNFIPIRYNSEIGEWCIYGRNDQVLKAGEPSEILDWVLTNLPQYRKQIMAGKNGFIPTHYDYQQKKRVPYPLYKNESVKKYLKVLKEEVVADGSSEHNPYEKRWKYEREQLKNFIANYGKLMTSRENGKQYKVYYDQTLSELIGINYCVCVQWDPMELKPKSTVYIRALDKFTTRIFQASYDDRGQDNMRGTWDDTNSRLFN